MVDPVVEKIGGTVIANVNITNLKTLSRPFVAATAVITLHDETGVNYQVPAGQKFIVVKVTFWSPTPASTRQMRLRSSVTVDTADGVVILDHCHLDNQILDIPVIIEVAATRFVTMEGTASDLIGCYVVGYEVAV